MTAPSPRNLLPLLALAPLLALGVGLAGGSAVLASTPPPMDEAPALHEPLPFDHALHAGAFDAARVACSDCHPIGVAVPVQEGISSPGAELPGPTSSCHGCHRQELPRTPRAAPSACASCHADLDALLPADHGAGWETAHAVEARAFRTSCLDCHETSQCFDCHDERGPGVENPHPPAFRSTHGVEARLDARSCSSCHTGETCMTCHEEGGWPW